MPGQNKEEAHFVDNVLISGFKACNNIDQEVRENAASLMLQAENHRQLTSILLKCLYDQLMFYPPLYINNEFYRDRIPYKEIIGFYLAPTYKNRLVLVVQEPALKKVFLYGIQMSTPQKTQELSSLLGDARSSSKTNSSSRDSRQKTVIVKPNTHEVQQMTKAYNADNISRKLYANRNGEMPKKTFRSEFNFDRQAGENLRVVHQKPLQNGFDIEPPISKTGLPTTRSEFPKRNVEIDWDDIRGFSNSYTADEMDERISIGYYNDETESVEDERVRTARDDKSTERPASPQNAWVENITYISNQTEGGSKINANGSIYMYVAQQVNSRNESQISL